MITTSGKQVLLSGEHFADAITEEGAERIAEALGDREELNMVEDFGRCPSDPGSHASQEWIFEPHNGFGRNDPDGVPWPFGYVSESYGHPVFELSAAITDDRQQLLASALLMTGSPALFRALSQLLTAVTFAAPPKNMGGTEDDPNLCYEARIPVEFVTNAERALAKAAIPASVDRSAERQDRNGLGPKDESAVGDSRDAQ